MKKQAEQKVPPVPSSGGYERIELEDLLLDAHNPRLAELGIQPSATQFDLVKALWEEMAVEEVAMSIAFSGYFDYEPLFVEPNAAGKYVVIEGNRRFAAVKLLVDASLRQRVKATKLPPITPERADSLADLPVIITTRQKRLRGAISGLSNTLTALQHGGSYARAQYIAHVHNDYGVPLEEIALQIGDYNSTVLRMYRGLMIVEQAEEARVFKRADIAKNKFFFNYIYTGMDYPGIISFLGLRGTQGATDRKPVPPNKVKNLGDLMVWLYGRDSSDTQSLIRSPNPDLKTLDIVLQTDAGVQALRDGLPLSVAHDISQGDERIFRQALQQAKQALQKAHGTLTTGYASGEDDMLKLAEDVDDLAHALVEAMEAKEGQGPARCLAKKG